MLLTLEMLLYLRRSQGKYWNNNYVHNMAISSNLPSPHAMNFMSPPMTLIKEIGT